MKKKRTFLKKYFFTRIWGRHYIEDYIRNVHLWLFCEVKLGTTVDDGKQEFTVNWYCIPTIEYLLKF